MKIETTETFNNIGTEAMPTHGWECAVMRVLREDNGGDTNTIK